MLFRSGKSQVGRRLGRTGLELTLEAVLRAIADAGLDIDDVDGIASYPGPAAGAAGFSGASITEVRTALGLRSRWYMSSLETAGQIGPVIEACMAVTLGLANHVVVFRSVWESTAAQQAGGGHASVLLGGVSYVSSSGIIAKLLGDLGRLGNRETPTILSILVLEDLTMAIYLPIVAVLLAGAGVLTGLVSLAVALGVVAVIVLFAVKIGPWLSRVVDSESNEVTVLVILGLVLFVGGLVQEVDVSAAVGAFLVGLALSGPVQHRAATLIEPLGNVFAAIFFFVFGLGIDATAVPPVILPALGLAVVTAATKAGLGWWAAGRAGVGKHGRWRAATTLIVRGEFSIVIAGLGVAAGVEGQLGPLAAAYVLVLAVVGSLLVRVARLPGFLDRSARGESRPGTV